MLKKGDKEMSNLSHIISKAIEKIKALFAPACTAEDCHESRFRGELCFDHFIEVETQEWNDFTDAVAEAYAVSVGMG